MRKKIITLSLATLVAISLSGCSIRFGINKRNSGETVNINEKIVYTDENKIEIDIKYGNISVSTHDGSEVIVTGSTNRGTDSIELNKSGNSIKIKDNSKDNVNFDLFSKNDSSDKMNIDIKVPRNFQGDLDFDYGAGEATITGLKCNKVDIDSGAGKLNLEDIVFEKLILSAGVGQSNINLTEKCGDIEIDGGVGEINISIAEVGGDLIFDGGVGSAKIRIPENAPVYFNTSSGIGSTKVTAKTSGENTYKFDLNVGIGEIKVYN